MNREILFKAKRKNWNEFPKRKWWVEGVPMEIEGDWFMMLNSSDNIALSSYQIRQGVYNANVYGVKIDENTICQYTGLTDKNGNKIWENDIVGYLDAYSTDNGYAEADCIGQVVWDNETLSFQVTERLSAESYEVLDECAVIGNIFDNSELLEGGADEWQYI